MCFPLGQVFPADEFKGDLHTWQVVALSALSARHFLHLLITV
jgi:hypothetical protein